MTGKQRLLRSEAVTTEAEAYKRLGALLEQAEEGPLPGVAGHGRIPAGPVHDRHGARASTRATYEGYIRRIINPALGDVQLRKLRGPLLDRLYAQLRACRELCGLKRLDQLDKNHACRPMAVSTVRQILPNRGQACEADRQEGRTRHRPGYDEPLPRG